MAESVIRDRLAQVEATIVAACAAAGRDRQEVTLVAVSKTQPADSVYAALVAGQCDFGENRPEEAVEKITAVGALIAAAGVPLPRWHMIGHIQSRKTRLIVPHFVLVHSVDSVKLAGKLAALAQDQACTLDILLEMNVSGEASKSGWEATNWRDLPACRESLWNDIRSILSMPGLRVCGLMTMAPIVEEMEQVRPVFAELRRLRGALAEAFPQASWHHLSMGMSDDYPVAIEEGATLVRVGRAIFGARMQG